jgi:TPR repeat protein
MAGTVFISFATKDGSFATTICDALEHRGIGCWIATRDIDPGENFQSAIFHAIRSAKVMVLVFSGNSQNSDEVKKEVVLAGQCRLVVIPVRVEDVKPDEAFAYELATRQWVDMFDDWERSIQRLVEQIVKVVGQQPGALPLILPDKPSGKIIDVGEPSQPSPAAPLPSPAARPTAEPVPAARAAKSSRPLMAGLAALAIVAVGAGAWILSNGFGTNSPSGTVASDTLDKGKAALDRKDYGEAMRLFRSAADQGNARAETYLGYLYDKGLGVPSDSAEAMRWYRKAADQGNPTAQKNIGNFYEQGTGVTRDYTEAMRWFRLAADQGNAAAQTNIGYLYENGLGVPQNYTEAMRWYRKAADQGEDTAQNNIGVLYDKGYGIAQDYGEAMHWYRLAANQGNIDAEYNLALLYADARGVAADLAEARHWMQKAAEAGDPEAKKWLGSHGG